MIPEILHVYDMNETNSLSRFLNAQQNTYEDALREITAGRKRSHWMWYIFPQVLGLGFTDTSKYYAIKDLQEAQAYLSHPVLGERLIGISKALMAQKKRDAQAVFGSPDELKLKSSMTLFSLVPAADLVFRQVIDAFFDGELDQKTLQLLGLW
ncbi:DUF1810 domain-containing protein [Pedobacter sp. GR22-6]|uniref:DUF1810 domain-containing protein n=1 Tax=Pedobacter sp. GR22-6 TaxID=3127957 RepID=UPI00307DA4DB